ncbi:hypothetical protein [Pseudomonas sp. HY7a-MNA-CIBAN-0227]|uniref:hypothetical protein n=1 Tax=Pseudomonas sp. HY7a-MNA-CIBAN-0227 TaxID=3140474 RepID=UPI0033249E12
MDKKVKTIGLVAGIIVLLVIISSLVGGESITPEGEKSLKVLTEKHEFMIRYLDEQYEKCLKDSKKDFCNKRNDYAKGQVEKNFKIERSRLIEIYKK